MFRQYLIQALNLSETESHKLRKVIYMYKQYLKQARQLMKQNRFFSFVYILGTGLAISMVMVMAIVYYIRTADIAPEDCRSRLLQLNRASVEVEG